jgi:transposase
MKRREGHIYLTVFAHLMDKRLLMATPGMNASVWESFAVELLGHNGHQKAIQHVASNISAAHTKGVSDDLSNAQVVNDNFHLIQGVVEVCLYVREADSPNDAGKQDRLERTRWMWLQNRAKWAGKEAQKSEAIALETFVTGLVCQLRLVFQVI